VSLRCEDVRFAEEGLVVTIPHSKTDPEGEGQTVGIPFGSHPETCPVRALRTWIEQSGVNSGFVFAPSAAGAGKWRRFRSAIISWRRSSNASHGMPASIRPPFPGIL